MSYTEYRRLQKQAKTQGIKPAEFRKRAFILGTSYGNLDVMKQVFAGNEQAKKDKRAGIQPDTEYYKTWRMFFDDDERWFFYN